MTSGEVEAQLSLEEKYEVVYVVAKFRREFKKATLAVSPRSILPCFCCASNYPLASISSTFGGSTYATVSRYRLMKLVPAIGKPLGRCLH
jgi:hypothetical protein